MKSRKSIDIVHSTSGDSISSFYLHDNDLIMVPFGQAELNSKEYLNWMNDPEITKTIGRFDYLMPVTRDKLIEYYQNLDRDNTVFLAIYHLRKELDDVFVKEESDFIGTLKIYDIDLLAKRASVGIVIGNRSDWGKGFASKSISMASRYIFDVLGLRKITAGYIESNLGMEQAFLKNGFEIEAIFKEQVFFQGQYLDHKFVCKFRN